MKRTFLVFGLLLLFFSCKTTDSKNNSLIEPEDKTVNLYAFIGKKISVQKMQRDTSKTEKIIGFNGDTIVQNVIYLDQKFKAQYQVLKNVFNKLETDTVEFLVFDHYGHPKFAGYEHVLLYISFNPEDGNLYHEKYQFDPVSKTSNGNWEGLNGESLETLFNEKKEGVLTARGLFE